MTNRIGPKQREILAVMQDDGGELYNDAGQWTVTCLDRGTRYSGRVQSGPCSRLFEQGYIYCVEVKEGYGLFGEARAVYRLTEKGKAAI